MYLDLLKYGLYYVGMYTYPIHTTVLYYGLKYIKKK